MESSILTSIKKLLGIDESYEHFDTDVIIHINTALMALTQIGVGPSEGFIIKDKTAIWTDFVPEKNIEGIKTYVYLKVKLVFDPPASSAVLESYNRMITELECRINYNVDTPTEENKEENQNAAE